MKIKINNILFATIAAALVCMGLASCSDDFGRYGGANGEKIKVTVSDFKMGEGFEGLQTRTSVDLSNKKYITTWTEGDYIDVFALGAGKFEGTAASNSHVKFQITDIAEGNEAHARFLGDGYGLLEGYEYAAYYPYKEGSDYSSDAVELSYDYSGTTITPDATNHIADFDYLVATPQIPEDQTVTLDFNHVGTLVRLRVYCPNAGTYNKIVLESEDDDAFVKKATLNVADGSSTIAETTNVMEFPITPTTVSENGTITIYFMTYPKNYKSKLLTVKISGPDYELKGTVVGKNFVGGNAESLNAVANVETMGSNGHDFVDLGLPSGTLWSTMNLGATDVDDKGKQYVWSTDLEFDDYTSVEMNSTNFPLYDSKNKVLQIYNAIEDNPVLMPEHDVANLLWGGSWVIPSPEEFEELYAYCDVQFVPNYGNLIHGALKFTNRSDESKFIILPLINSVSTEQRDNYGPVLPGYSEWIYFRSCYLTNTLYASTGVNVLQLSLSNFSSISNYDELVVGNYVGPNGIGASCGVRPVIRLKKEEKKNLHNGYEYVDLGLSVKWATMNVGATEVAGTKMNSRTGKLDCFGEYYAWGETAPKDDYSYNNYKFSINGPDVYTKYNATDNYTLLEPEDDAAHVNMGGNWRIPTSVEYDELVNNCYWIYTPSYKGSGVPGYMVFKVRQEAHKGGKVYQSSNYNTTFPPYTSSDTHIFLPVGSGMFSGTSVSATTTTSYWVNSLYPSSIYYGRYYYFYSTSVTSGTVGQDRSKGLSIRAVFSE